MLNLLGRRYFNYRVALLAVNSNDGQFGFYFDHMFKIPAYQYWNVVNGRYSYVKSIGKIFPRYNLGINITLGKLSHLFSDGKNFYLIFFDNIFKNSFLDS